MSSTSKPKDANAPVDSFDAWAEAATHTILCPSGVRVGIRIPDLAALIEGGELPQHLLDAALKAAGQTPSGDEKKVTVEDVKREMEFTNFIVYKTVVKPDISLEQAARIPAEDKELIASIALRLRDYDAEYAHIGGLDTSEKFRRFRRLGEFDTSVEGL